MERNCWSKLRVSPCRELTLRMSQTHNYVATALSSTMPYDNKVLTIFNIHIFIEIISQFMKKVYEKGSF